MNRGSLPMSRRGATRAQCSFGKDPRHINIFPPHAWGPIHKSHEMSRCDATVFCRSCGASSSTYKATLPAISASLDRDCGTSCQHEEEPPLGALPVWRWKALEEQRAQFDSLSAYRGHGLPGVQQEAPHQMWMCDLHGNQPGGCHLRESRNLRGGGQPQWSFPQQQ